MMEPSGFPPDSTYRDHSLTRAEALLEGEKRLLDVIAQGGPLASTLDALCRVAEEVHPDLRLSILVLDDKEASVRSVAAPGLPPSYVAALAGSPTEFSPGGSACLGAP